MTYFQRLQSVRHVKHVQSQARALIVEQASLPVSTKYRMCDILSFVSEGHWGAGHPAKTFIASPPISSRYPAPFKTLTFFAIISLLFLTTSVPTANAQPISRTDRPNILYIISDDQGWRDFGFMAHPTIRTPNIDRLARESLCFRNGYVPSSLCCPSLASILTGKYPHQSKITGNEPPLPAGVAEGMRYRDPGFQAQLRELNGFLEKQARLPDKLAKAGYVSLQTGKWWMGNYKTGGFTEGMSHGDPNRGGRHGDEGLKIGRETMQPIFDFMQRAKQEKKPFFVWYAPILPHQPHNPPERLLEKYRGKTNSEHIARYWAMCEWFDETVGLLLNYLDREGLAKNTLVVFCVDNGWVQPPDQPQFRADSKQSAYNNGLRAPILFRWPGQIAPHRSDTPVSTIDIFPTVARLASIPVPRGLPGINLLDEKQVENRKAIFGACFLHTAIDIQKPERNWTYRWCVSDGWKLIVPNPKTVQSEKKPGRGMGAELYRLDTDPDEENNLAASRPEIVQSLRQQLDRWWRPGTDG